ncbi:hypothetical protein QRX60_39425 [Amycolatopsis mongoliensis]|uniref:Uncharacterized protein n=1 Tax=Amycolatopsis mongoliensis TaxID=715475 RepID=A0A9Y2NCX7_9PSEU|nr:hypothetical protein [Amycolatopsis sp. 4-36]WIY00077.1 hypothetical protein QRX60_39425 [Amycolatopsis sp. 4-36]
MTNEIVGKVAQVTSDRELIINRGSLHGVVEGMVFRVKGSPVEVLDPDTNEVIGQIAKVKVLIRAVEVAERFCIARTFRSRKVNVGGRFEGVSLANAFQPPKWETRYETLRRDPSAGESISPDQSVVSIGDSVELAQEEDFDAEATTVWK